MIKKKNLFYVTYQNFPADTANSLQTISNIKYFVRNNINVTLFFPLREAGSSDNLSIIQNKYEIKENFKVTGVNHNLPFGKLNFFNKFFFLISHYLWSKNTVSNLLKNYKEPDLFITRSDWVFYFLSKNKKNVIFECHQYSKLRKLLLSKSLKNEKSKIIFLNENLKNDYTNQEDIRGKSIVLHNAVDFDLFDEKMTKNKNEIIFIGKLTRFNESRNIDFIIKSIIKSSNNFKFKIIGASEEEKVKISKLLSSIKSKEDIKVLGRLNRKSTIEEIKKAEIGLLINSDKNEHSTKYTSPLKYFEYLAAGLKILAVDFDSHRKLPFSDNIIFFQDKDFESFKLALNKVPDYEQKKASSLKEISLDKRVKNIIKFSGI